ncbi:non-ribosomal peptide synthetase, partial [Aldersonia kunmingensis]|uniref:non-ribosomal peptide synthetase n=1 Tax=Aldersonia kunmingensis TaxID=408066 RepID=UPI001471C459
MFGLSTVRAKFTELMQAERVTHTIGAPAVLGTVDADQLTTLESVVVGGDVCSPDLVARFGAVARFHNSYGPTETTIVTTLTAPLTDPNAVTLGGLLPGVRALVLDARLRPVAPGVLGELYLAGSQLARGYHRRPDLTAGRFIADPTTPGQRLYRTGDLVRWQLTPDHPTEPVLSYVGRDDDQVQLNGIRVEPGEIDATLITHPSVAFALTVVNRATLVSYVHETSGHTVDIDELSRFLRDRLPAHLVPQHTIVVPEVPLTPNGKVDRRALPEPDWATAQYVAPRTADERRIADLFAAVTGAEKVGRTDNFFALGGNSLSATRVIGTIRRTRGATIGVRALFEAPTVAEFAAIVTGAERDDRPALEARPRPDRIPLSLAQSRMWFLNRFDPDSTAYNIPIVVRLSGDLDIGALRAAIGDVVARHESLRTVYPEDADGPVQVVLPVEQSGIDLPVITTAAEAVPNQLAELLGRGFDVTDTVPLRAALLSVDTDWILAVVVHHISADGVSTTPLARDVFIAYTARRAGHAPDWAPLAVQYADYTLWQREVLGADTDAASASAQQIAYWRNQLASVPEVIELPTDRPRPAVASQRGATVTAPVDPAVMDRVHGLAAAHGVSVFMLTHAVFAVLLSRLGAGTDVVVGTPVAGRGDPGLDDLIGMFVNTIVLRTHIDPAAPFTDTLAAVRDTDLDAFAHTDIPFEGLVEALTPSRSQAHGPLFQVVFAYDHAQPNTLELPDLTVAVEEFYSGASQFDLTLRLREADAPIVGDCSVNAALTFATDLFDTETAEGLLDRYLTALDVLTREPGTRVGDLDLLTGDERATLVPASGGAGADPLLLTEILASGVAANPDGAAVIADDRVISYRELDTESNRLARLLLGHGAGPETFVAVAFPRSVEAIVAVWAIAKSGSAFVPIDPNHPGERITHMLTDSGAGLGLTLTGLRDTLPTTATTWLCADSLDLAQYSPAPVTDTDRPAPLHPQHPAYVIYTSGSTGLPKGVILGHTGLSTFTEGLREEFRTGPDSRMLRFSSASFDASVFEMLHAFHAGAALVIAPPGVYGGTELTDLMARHRVTHTLVAPAILGTVDAAALPDLEMVAVGGDVCPPDLVTRFGSRARFHNCYGPTEATIMSTRTGALTDPTSVTIGSLLPGVHGLVLDARLHPVPPGVAGELYVTGIQLARGYHRRPDLTAGRFVADPTGSGQRLYRTGDLVRWRRDTANLEYLGRSDDQVQLNGVRVEPGEVDATLHSHSSVDFALTVVHRDALISYVHAATDNTVDVTELLDHARALLPTHMVPKQIIELAEVPLTPNGKVDRKALPEPDWAAAEYVAPHTPLEEMVAAVFGEITGAERVGRWDDFFALGGNSLSATRVVGTLRQRVRVTVAVRGLFDNPTVAGFAAVLAGAQRDSRPALEARPRPDRTPLSLAQTRMWFLNRFDPESAVNNIPLAVRLTGALDVDAMRLAVADVVQRHESLRTIYPEIDGVGYQQVLAPEAVELDLAPIPVGAGEVASAVAGIATAGFDVTTSAPVRVRLLEITDVEFVLVVVVHHIAGDGASMQPLARDVMVAYAARTRGEEPGWASLAVQYADYTLWQREVLGD